VRECLENFESRASRKSDRCDDHACRGEIRSHIRNGTSDDYITPRVQRLDLPRRLTTDYVHVSAGFHFPDLWENRSAKVEGGIDIGLIIHLAREQKSMRIFQLF